ncbi:transposase-like protein [Bradyrhizobium sp. USDA 3256]
MRNALALAGKSGRRAVSAFIATTFAQGDAETAKAQWRRVSDQLRPKLPKLAGFLDDAKTDALAYMTFPRSVGPHGPIYQLERDVLHVRRPATRR